ncbi:ankyrin [Hypoxylon argillaceum]|nr:ankyrin [Hypoxylon argillaceum]
MDPVSAVGFVASIIQLIETTAKVVRYVNAVKDAPTERAQFARHASSLLALLTDLRYRVEDAKSASETWFVALRSLGVGGGPLDQLQGQMECLATKLQPVSNTDRLEKARKALAWTLNKKEIVEALAQIERVKTLVMLALQNDQFKLTLAMKQDLMDVKEDLRGAIGGANAERQDEEFEQITSWLSSLEFTTKQIDFLKRHWVDGKERMLWCRGLPIKEVTNLVYRSMVIDWLERQHRAADVAVIYLYCSYKEEEVQTAENMVGSLLKQLVYHRAALPDDNTRILITSRYSLTIEDKFGNVPQIDIRATDDDVKRYVEACIEEKASLAKHVRSSPEMIEEITETVIQTSQGMFLLAQLHMDSLARKLTRRQIRAALASLPKELDETYDQAIQRMQNQDEDQASLAHKVLYWISYSFRPLTITELQHALAVELDDDDLDEDGLYDTELMISVCGGLVTVDIESNQIRLVHYTAQSYLERVRGELFPEAPLVISGTCLTYLSFSRFAESYCLNIHETRARLNKYPFLSYAASYWGNHMHNGIDDDIRKRALKYLSNSISIVSAYQASSDKRHFYYLGVYFLGIGMSNITRLHVIALFGLAEIAEEVLVTSVDAIDRQTPLHMAAKNGHEAVVKLLIEAGADCNDYSPQKGADINQKDAVAYRTKRHAHKEPSLRLDNNDKIRECDNNDEGGTEKFGATLLSRAAKKGNKDLLLLLLDNGADISATDENGCTALHSAARVGHVKLVEELISRGIDIFTTDKTGQTALHYAAKHDQIGVVQRLLESNADVRAKDKEGRTPADEAAQREHESILNILLERLGKGNEAERWLTDISLYRAVNQADADNVRLLLGKGADVDAKIQFTPIIHIAITHESNDVLQLLLANGASTKEKDSFGRTPLHWAVYRGYSTGVQLLLDHNADIEATNADGATPLHIAAQEGSFLMVNKLLDNGARIDARDRRGCTKGANVAAKADNGYTAMDEAARRGLLEVAQLLLEYGANVNHKHVGSLSRIVRYGGKSVNGMTALHEAVKSTSYEVTRLLINAGADIKAVDENGHTPLHYAIRGVFGSRRIIKLFLAHGVDINAHYGKKKATVLHYAAMLANIVMVRFLVEEGARIDATDIDGKTALDWVEHEGHEVMIFSLRRYIGELEGGRGLQCTGISSL